MKGGLTMEALAYHRAPRVSDVNVVEMAVLPAPELLQREIPRTEAAAEFVAASREELHRLIFGDDPRLLVVLGPCSIHDPAAGLDYARRLAPLARELSDKLYVVMRAYFEKPRTTVGWKGLIMDPHLDGSHDIPTGLRTARQFLRSLIDLGLPTATELLDPITPQYIADLVCYSAIGARTTESQTHRQMASGLSMPLGFKNTTAGAVQPAINAVKAAGQPQTFLGISHQGLASCVTTRGNPDCHIILRGGDAGPNYAANHVAEAEALLRKADLLPAIMVDCSHGNSQKDHRRQAAVLRDLVAQRRAGRAALIGVMLESNLAEGAQSFPRPKKDLAYGQSITDACLGWDETEALLREAHAAL